MNYIPQKFQVRVQTNNHLSLLFLDFLREEPICDIPSCNLFGSPHHLYTIGSGRNRKKPLINHLGAVRLCDMPHHSYVTQFGADRFKDTFLLDLWKKGLDNLMDFTMRLANGQLDKKYFKALKIQYEEL